MRVQVQEPPFLGKPTLGEGLQVVEGWDSNQDRDEWEFPIEDTLLIDKQRATLKMDGIESIIDSEVGWELEEEIEQVVNEYLESEGQGLQIETDRVEDNDPGNFGYRTHKIIYRYRHTEYTGEETDDLLRI